MDSGQQWPGPGRRTGAAKDNYRERSRCSATSRTIGPRAEQREASDADTVIETMSKRVPARAGPMGRRQEENDRVTGRETQRHGDTETRGHRRTTTRRWALADGNKQTDRNVRACKAVK